MFGKSEILGQRESMAAGLMGLDPLTSSIMSLRDLKSPKGEPSKLEGWRGGLQKQCQQNQFLLH